MKTVYLHLISDSTGETLHSVGRIAGVSFQKQLNIQQCSWPLTTGKAQVLEIMKIIKNKPGLLLCTVADQKLQRIIDREAKRLQMPCISVLSEITSRINDYLTVMYSEAEETLERVKGEVRSDGVTRTEAINFTIEHDDGQRIDTIDEADIVITGLSRTTKTPTGIYLAYRGYKVANVPLVMDISVPEQLLQCRKALVVGFITSPVHLTHVRKSRMLSNNSFLMRDDYTDVRSITEELKFARSLFVKQGWMIVDITNKSIEEVAAMIIKAYSKNQYLGS